MESFLLIVLMIALAIIGIILVGIIGTGLIFGLAALFNKHGKNKL